MRLYEIDTLEQTIDTRPYRAYFERFETPAVFRGVPTTKGIARIVNPAQKERTSVSTSNEYTLLLSNLPEWSMFPKRNRSLICSTNPDYARTYGHVYAVVLPEKFTLGVCSRKDLWLSFPYMSNQLLLSDMGQFNFELSQILGKHPTSFEDMIAQIKITERKILNKKWDGQETNLVEYVFPNVKKEGDLLALIRGLLDPENNKLYTVNQFDAIPIRDQEVWTSDTCLLVLESVYEAYRRKVLGL